jgi:hypothetical protein
MSACRYSKIASSPESRKGFMAAANQIHVLLRHRPRSISRGSSACYGAGGATPVPLLGERSAITPPQMARTIPTTRRTVCFQPQPGSPIPSGLANAAISAATTPTRATAIPICLLDMAAGRLSRGRGIDTHRLKKPPGSQARKRLHLDKTMSTGAAKRAKSIEKPISCEITGCAARVHGLCRPHYDLHRYRERNGKKAGAKADARREMLIEEELLLGERLMARWNALRLRGAASRPPPDSLARRQKPQRFLHFPVDDAERVSPL